VARAVGEFGRLDVLVNNAGVSMSACFEDLEDIGFFEQLMQVSAPWSASGAGARER
jgi:NAD(P)-dependent dehydrogenase (short-subunit alcohol dehydrogenase family)